MVAVVPQAVAQPLDTQSRRTLAEYYFDKAGSFDPQKGEGDIAWMYLLAAHSIDDEVSLCACMTVC